MEVYDGQVTAGGRRIGPCQFADQKKANKVKIVAG